MIGWVASHFLPQAFKTSSHKEAQKAEYLPSIIDDDTAIPDHAKYQLSRLLNDSLLELLLAG